MFEVIILICLDIKYPVIIAQNNYQSMDNRDLNIIVV